MNGAASSLQLDESFCGVFSGSFGVLEVGFCFGTVAEKVAEKRFSAGCV